MRRRRGARDGLVVVVLRAQVPRIVAAEEARRAPVVVVVVLTVEVGQRGERIVRHQRLGDRIVEHVLDVVDVGDVVLARRIGPGEQLDVDVAGFDRHRRNVVHRCEREARELALHHGLGWRRRCDPRSLDDAAHAERRRRSRTEVRRSREAHPGVAERIARFVFLRLRDQRLGVGDPRSPGDAAVCVHLRAHAPRARHPARRRESGLAGGLERLHVGRALDVVLEVVVVDLQDARLALGRRLDAQRSRRRRRREERVVRQLVAHRLDGRWPNDGRLERRGSRDGLVVRALPRGERRGGSTQPAAASRSTGGVPDEPSRSGGAGGEDRARLDMPHRGAGPPWDAAPVARHHPARCLSARGALRGPVGAV